MLSKKKLLLLYIIGLLLLVGCVKIAIVKIEVVPKNSGKIIGVGEYEVGSSVSLQAQPSENYIFIGWEKNNEVIEKNKNYKFIINSDEKLVAKFEKEKIRIEVEVNDPEMGFADGGGEYQIDDEVIFFAEPKEKYNFVGWFNKSDKFLSDQLELKVNADSNKTYFAKFEPIKFKINLKSNIEQAKVYGQGEFIKGKKQFIRAEEIAGYNFLHWEDENGDVFLKEDGKMITVDKDLNLTAIYEKKEEVFYMGFTKDEIEDFLKNIFEEYFASLESTYGGIANIYINADETLHNSFRAGDYFLALRPFQEGYYEFRNIDFVKKVTVNKIIIEGNKLIIKASLEVPQLNQLETQDKMKNEIENQLPIINRTFSSFFGYDSIETEKYMKEVHLKKEKGNLKLIYLEKSTNIYSKFSKLYQSLIVEQIQSINIFIENSVYKKTIVNYNGKLYEGEFNEEIFNYKELFPKIYFKFNNETSINLFELCNNLRNKKLKLNIVNLSLFRGLDFFEENDPNKITFGSSYAVSTGGSINSILGYYDISTNNYFFTEVIRGQGLLENNRFSTSIQYSSDAVAVVFTDLMPRDHLEVFDLELKNRIEINEYLPKKYTENYSYLFKYKNIDWTDNHKLIFDLYSVNDKYEADEKISSFVFDLEKGDLTDK